MEGREFEVEVSVELLQQEIHDREVLQSLAGVKNSGKNLGQREQYQQHMLATCINLQHIVHTDVGKRQKWR